MILKSGKLDIKCILEVSCCTINFQNYPKYPVISIKLFLEFDNMIVKILVLHLAINKLHSHIHVSTSNISKYCYIS